MDVLGSGKIELKANAVRVIKKKLAKALPGHGLLVERYLHVCQPLTHCRQSRCTKCDVIHRAHPTLQTTFALSQSQCLTGTFIDQVNQRMVAAIEPGASKFKIGPRPFLSWNDGR